MSSTVTGALTRSAQLAVSRCRVSVRSRTGSSLVTVAAKEVRLPAGVSSFGATVSPAAFPRRQSVASSRTSLAVMAAKEVHLGAEGAIPFNGPVSASGRDSTVYGSERPGMLPELDAPGAISDEEVAKWVKHMKENNITQAMSLLSPEELEYYATPLAEQYAAAFNAYEFINMKAAGAHEKAMAFLSAADAKGEKVVLHCSGGQGRTGVVLASWLVQKYGLSPQDAVAEMMEHATKNGASRHNIADKLPGFIKKGSM